MFLHLGRDTIVSDTSIVGIFDLDTSTGSRHTQAFLKTAEREGRVINVTNELPKSAVLCLEEGRASVYLSQLSTQTLHKRAQQISYE